MFLNNPQQHSLKVEQDELPLSLYSKDTLEVSLQEKPLQTLINQVIINNDDIPPPGRLIRLTAVDIKEYKEVFNDQHM
tara:strand:+ start:298 stop:531 length:234 start_codon:yes stop_codon:yes gene_type:complete